MCVCVCVCVHACVRCARVCASVCLCVCVVCSGGPFVGHKRGSVCISLTLDVVRCTCSVCVCVCVCVCVRVHFCIDMMYMYMYVWTVATLLGAALPLAAEAVPHLPSPLCQWRAEKTRGRDAYFQLCPFSRVSQSHQKE